MSGGVGKSRIAAIDIQQATIAMMRVVDAAIFRDDIEVEDDAGDDAQINHLYEIGRAAAQKYLEVEKVAGPYTSVAMEEGIQQIVDRQPILPGNHRHCFNCLTHVPEVRKNSSTGELMRTTSWRTWQISTGANKRVCGTCGKRSGYNNQKSSKATQEGADERQPEIPGCTELNCSQCTIVDV